MKLKGKEHNAQLFFYDVLIGEMFKKDGDIFIRCSTRGSGTVDSNSVAITGYTHDEGEYYVFADSEKVDAIYTEFSLD